MCLPVRARVCHNGPVSGGNPSRRRVLSSPTRLVRWSTAALAATLLAAGCARSSQIDGAGDAEQVEVAADAPEIPAWIQRAYAAAAGDDEGPGAIAPPTRRSSAPDDDSGLPARTVAIPALISAGLTADQAECVYSSLSSNPALATDLEAFTSSLSATPDGGLDPTSLSGIDPDSSARILASFAPCLDAGSLSLLIGGLGSVDSLASLLPALGTTGLDPAALANLDLSGLDPATAATLGGIISSAGSSGVPDISGVDLSAFDLATLDLSSIPPERLPLLVLAIFAGLSPAQRSQLSSLAQVDFERLGINVDVDSLTPEQIGGLLLLISPLAVAAVSPTGAAPPPGADPNQIYIPPGTDLSQINPLNFVPRDTVVQGAIDQGVNPGAAGCLFDNLRSVSPLSLGSIFSSSPNPVAVAELALAAIRCVVSP